MPHGDPCFFTLHRLGHPLFASHSPFFGFFSLSLKGQSLQRPDCAASLFMANTTINPLLENPSSMVPLDHTLSILDMPGRRPQLDGCPLHLSLKPFRIDNRDPGTWIATLLCTEYGTYGYRLSLVSSPLPLPSLLTSPQCNFHDVHSTALGMMPTPRPPIPQNIKVCFRNTNGKASSGLVIRVTPCHRPRLQHAPHRTAPLCTTCSRAGSSPDLMPSGDSNTYMALQHYARSKRQLAETEMDTERGRRKSHGQVLHLPLNRSPFSEEAPSSTFDAVTPALDTLPLPQDVSRSSCQTVRTTLSNTLEGSLLGCPREHLHPTCPGLTYLSSDRTAAAYHTPDSKSRRPSIT
ncbi:hypothetical protein BDP81DRAFT_453039 [Colletotrichum phormii]|uniref:Uncharacterized protein n=1 Tax=Colletotrichum phormii TaxID=359342 RepID=A0AAJ0EAI3_9PEZI|nr:uncharacterized protein BDP81DRAFT_453039 [Colletotrichum phormii]KAK1625109.1 hypothetical protein BDP81DRAFT_453039 [Colletotrichum phormii]